MSRIKQAKIPYRLVTKRKLCNNLLRTLNIKTANREVKILFSLSSFQLIRSLYEVKSRSSTNPELIVGELVGSTVVMKEVDIVIRCSC